ncbi:MAG TPA: class I SAM-dependent methyltransferase [Phycisphaerae bacterium]|nr:class I SAM-dependent methyltransferase [Phycisphaerae bacterium]
MDLTYIVRRSPRPQPWAEGDNIPWHEPAFSRRMLAEHLSQEHDLASRRTEIIDRQVQWIHRYLLGGRATRILDLGCGPGLYSSRLARLGHECVGIDFSPASIGYATDRAQRSRLRCHYVLDDIRRADYGSGFGLVMLIYGEFNVFCRDDARSILAKAHTAIVSGGVILLEPHPFAEVERQGRRGRAWHSAESGLFAESPHVCLQESFWDAATHTATFRYYVVDAATAEVTRHACSFQAYTDQEYRSLLNEMGFDGVQLLSSLGGEQTDAQGELMTIVARRVR